MQESGGSWFSLESGSLSHTSLWRLPSGDAQGSSRGRIVISPSIDDTHCLANTH